MKRLVIINLMLILVLMYFPKSKNIDPVEQICTVVNRTEQISSRSLDAPRQENASYEIQEAPVPVTTYSEDCINLIKKYEGFRKEAYLLEGESNWTIRIWT